MGKIANRNRELSGLGAEQYYDIDSLGVGGAYFKQLVTETLLQANIGSINKTSVGLTIFVCLPLAAISSVIYYKPNLKAADSTAANLGLPNVLCQVILVTGGVVSNFILNAYFSYEVPKTIINRVRAVAWPCFRKTTFGKINYRPQEASTIMWKGTLNAFKLLFKAIPVAMSTAQYVALGVDAGVSDIVLVGQVGAYGLMHWFAVTHFLENWGDGIVGFIKKLFLSRSSQSKFESYLLKCQKTLILTYQTTIQNTLYRLRKTWQYGENERLIVLYNKLELLLKNVNTGRIDTIYEEAFDFHLQLLKEAKQPNIQMTYWLKLLPFHFINAILTKLCYLSFDLAVWHQAPQYCINIIQNESICNDSYFIIPFRLLTVFPLSYLATCIVAPGNTNKLWNLISQLRQEKYVKPLALQRYPGKVYFISGCLILMALFSWGATISLNETYIHDKDILVAANTNSIIYNTYFNSFAIPFVAVSFAILISKLMGGLIGFFSDEQDDYLAETLRDNTLELFLEELSRNVELLETLALLKQIRSFNDNEKIKVFFEGKEPNEVLDDWPVGICWIDTIDFLINPPSLDAFSTTSIQEYEEETDALIRPDDCGKRDEYMEESNGVLMNSRSSLTSIFSARFFNNRSKSIYQMDTYQTEPKAKLGIFAP